jgi:hypothetical protein
MTKWVSPIDGSRETGLSTSLIRRLALNGTLQEGTDYIVVSKRGDRRYSLESLRRWLAERGVAAA